MSRVTYRSAVYRGAYAVVFVGAYLFLAAYLLSGDDSGSDSSAGVWRLLVGLLLVGLIGALTGPALHRYLFKSRAAYQKLSKSRKRHGG